MTRRPSRQTLLVVEFLLADPGRWAHGYELSQQLGIKSGTLYPMLMRLEQRGILETRWADSPDVGRPRRRLFRLTDHGQRWARAVVADAAARSPRRSPELGTA